MLALRTRQIPPRHPAVTNHALRGNGDHVKSGSGEKVSVTSVIQSGRNYPPWKRKRASEATESLILSTEPLLLRRVFDLPHKLSLEMRACDLLCFAACKFDREISADSRQDAVVVRGCQRCIGTEGRLEKAS